MSTLEHLLKNNEGWAQHQCADDPDFFTKIARRQSPDYLWIGCSDSRVPAEDLVGLLPGELFVHRNIANIVGHTDLNVLSVIQFAVEVLKIQHVIVCGHYGCGGVKVALKDDDNGLIDNWLLNIKDIYQRYEQELDAIKDDDKRHEVMCELNVIEQVRNVCRTTVVRNAWKSGQSLTVHGWVYKLNDGRIKNLGTEISNPDELDPCYRLTVNKAITG
ncbi:MAG: carbonate dehydratase [Proteobacteria bacterium]|nr:carbonate dehydratase [Pseudomonadota bacterium]